MTSRPWWMALALGVAACVGDIDNMPGTTGPGEDPGSPDNPGGGGTAARPPKVAACMGTPNPGHVLVHRLNRLEYNNTIRDLLGNHSRPADEFPPDVPVAGFDNNAAGLPIDPDLLVQLDGAAERLAQSAVTTAGFLSCDPSSTGEAACAKKVLEPFARRAWRRPVTTTEVDDLVKIVQVAKANADTFENGMALAVRTVLVSPNFLYRFEYPPKPDTTSYLLDAHSVASRLSYFLWSSMPDDKLSDAADSGALLKPDELGAQITRMLADAKVNALAENLAGQWLSARLVMSAAPDPLKFPQFNSDLRTSIQTETTLFLNAFFQENLDMRNLLDADFTFLDQRLAQHYKIADKTIPQTSFKKYPLVNHAQRGGIITHASFHVATSKPEQPSIPQRGKWVLNNLLCTPPAPPPMNANAEQTKIDGTLGPNPTRRQQAEARDMRAVCGGCHARLDPIGIALDKYDSTGAWREKDGTQAIDIRGQWNGETFTGPRPLARLLKKETGVPSCITGALFRYALGRTTADSDQCLLDDIRERALAGGFKAQDIIAALVTSPAFQYQAE